MVELVAIHQSGLDCQQDDVGEFEATLMCMIFSYPQVSALLDVRKRAGRLERIPVLFVIVGNRQERSVRNRPATMERLATSPFFFFFFFNGFLRNNRFLTFESGAHVPWPRALSADAAPMHSKMPRPRPTSLMVRFIFNFRFWWGTTRRVSDWAEGGEIFFFWQFYYRP